LRKSHKVDPPLPHPQKGCPDGFCIVGLNAPLDGVAITEGADQVEKICGKTRSICTIGVGDWNISPQRSIVERWKQLIGGSPKLVTTGNDHAKIATNLETEGGMNIDIGFPLQKQFGNITGEQQMVTIDLLVPCEHPGTFINDGCLK
jgi:hypothetical protein